MDRAPKASGRPAAKPAPGPDGPAPPARARPEPGQLPSLAQQKRFIVDNVAVLNRETKVSILSIVMMEIGATVPVEGDPTRSRSVMYESGGREVDVDLDAVGAINPEVLTHLYNIVHARREQLSQPARQ